MRRAWGATPSLLVLLALAAGAAAAHGQGATTSCLACHGDPEWFDEAALGILDRMAQDVHAEVGLSCHDCHGGDPDPALADDMDAAMDPAFAANPYRGVPERTAIPGFCGRCHSDPATMRRFRPDARVDQEREYWTSRHGQALRQGDGKVATCIDCHGVHGVLRAIDPASPVYPTRVAETCGQCHSDPGRMAGYILPDGRPMPVDQHARWRQSVHAAALLEREDLSAPTCNDCHGNHGATPPGLDAIAFVCGQCHGREAQLFRASGKYRKLGEHAEYMVGTGSEGCAACHEAPEPQASFTAPHPFSECASCHGNHAVVRPTVALLSPLPETPCAFCHEGPLAEEVPEPEAKRRSYEQMRGSLLAAGEAADLSGDALFDWLVDRALTLPTHTQAVATDGGERLVLRPEFERLFSKFRIGKTAFTYRDPATGQEVRAPVIRCRDCHAEEPLLADQARGLAAGKEFLERMQELTSGTARAERILLAARRGGVETREALLAIDQAVDAQIELEVLVHTFASGPESPFGEKHREGLEHARAGLAAGQEALAELAFRRRGLAVSLVVVALVLVALALKIRSLAEDAR